jgi:AraC-like DNA-binding protein
MRADGNEPIIDLNFDCANSPGSVLKRNDVGGMTYVRHEIVSGVVSRPTTGYINVPTGMNVLCINLKGTLIARTGSSARLILAPPRSLTYIRGARLIVQAARGEHQTTLISWHSNVTSLLDAWIQARYGRGSANQRSVACKPIDPQFRTAIERFDAAMNGPAETQEPIVVSVLYEIVAQLMVGMDQVQLAAAPFEMPETIKDLIAEVRANPAQGWPLKEAANKAGYSPFHFSRVFKNIIGYGFHEYVDRCRTECAVELLVMTPHAVDLVASSCGFGTTQALRESVKDYLGLVPSELRYVPEEPPEPL